MLASEFSDEKTRWSLATAHRAQEEPRLKPLQQANATKRPDFVKLIFTNFTRK